MPLPITRRSALMGGLAAATAAGAQAGALHRPETRPNFLVICADDMTFADAAYMHNLKKLLGKNGTNFSRHFCPYTFCGPSRVSFFTGLYAHNHGITDNDGAYQEYVATLEANALPVWMQSAGYFVGHVGKYVNDGSHSYPPTRGFDWWASIEGSFEKYTWFTLNENGTDHNYRHGEYITDILTQRVIDFFGAVPEDKPWMMVYWPNASHGPATPATQDSGTVDPESCPIAAEPSFNVNIPGEDRDILGSDEIATIKQTWANRIECLQCLDRGLAQIVAALTQSGEIANTHIIFTSDNGYQQGEHCINDSKAVLYEESARLPLIWLQPGGTPNGISVPVSTIDVTATIVDLASAVSGRTLDGQSMRNILAGDVAGWKTAVLMSCPFSDGVASQSYRYIEWHQGLVELFDMTADPYQTTNVAGIAPYADIQTRLASSLHALNGCAGDTCVWTKKFPHPPAG